MTDRKSANLANLIDMVYETASDVSQWPRLLEGMTRWVEDHAAAGMPPSPSESATAWVRPWFDEGMPIQNHFRAAHVDLLSLLGPHFLRAHDLHRQLADAELDRNTLEQVTNQLPLGLAVLSAQGRVISINATMLMALRGNPNLAYVAGAMVSRPGAALASALAEVLGSSTETSVRLEADGQATLLWLARLSNVGHRSKARVLVLCAPSVGRRLPESGLRRLYGLTEAEARLTSRLAQGNTLEENARELSISVNTAKTLLKRVFAKVGVRRQTDLLQTLYASPLWLAPTSPVASLEEDALDRSTPDRMLHLAVGRYLSYSDSGPKDGMPVFLMHGIAGSRRLFSPGDQTLEEVGVRLIVPERPGCGHSTPAAANHGVLDWPPDVLRLADHLKIKEFGVLGYSSGTSYALACAWKYPERVQRVVLAASMPEVRSLADLGNFQPTFRMTLTIARMAPSLAPAVIRVMIRGIRNNVYRYIEEVTANGTDSDRKVFEDPVFRRWYAESLLSAARQGEQHIAQEVLLAVNAWGIRLDQIHAPVDLWHGDGDHLVSAEGARRLAAQLPQARLHMVAEAGHYIVYSHWKDILRSFKP